MAELDPTGGTIQLGDLGLRTPSLVGNAESVDSLGGDGLRAARWNQRRVPGRPRASGDGDDPRRRAPGGRTAGRPVADGRADRAGGGDGSAIELDVPQPLAGLRAGRPVGRRARRHDLVVRRRPPNAGRAFAAEAPREHSRSGARRAPPPEPGAGADRSIFGEIGKQVLKVVAFPVGQAARQSRRTATSTSGRSTHQGYGVRDYGTDNYTAPAAVLRRRHRALAGAGQGPDAAVRPRHVQPGPRRVQRPAARRR